MNKTRVKHLEELNHSDYKIADDQPDIENWKIVDTTGKKVGKVRDFLFDKEAMKVRYLITNLKDGELLSDDRDVLIPIGKAQLNTSKERVVVPNITRDQLSTLPHYRKADEITQEDEYAVRNAFGGAAATGATTGAYNRETFYEHEDFNEDRFYEEHDATLKDNNRNTRTSEEKVDVVEENLEVGKREVETGGARVRSRVVERPVEERVNLREENVKVNRNPVDKPASNADLNKRDGETIEKTETSEVPVVNKEARVVEEVSLEKEVHNKEEVVKDNVKKTEVDVDKNINNKDAGRTANDRDRLNNDKNRDGLNNDKSRTDRNI